MRAVVEAFLLLAAAAADGGSVPAVRPQTARLLAAYELARANSPTFEGVVAALAERRAIVFVAAGACDFGRREACLPHQVTIAGEYRILHVVVRDDLARVRLAGLLAHELQHALEVARAGVIDASGFDALFSRIGRPCEAQHAGTCYETDAAIEIQSRVVDELTRLAAPR